MPGWAVLVFGSALMLAFYDLAKKHAVRDNAVMPSLFFATLCGSVAFLGWLALQGRLAAAMAVPWPTRGLLFLKGVIVGSSWTAAYFAVRELPVSISAPLRATAPLYTIIGGILIYGEIPDWRQACGIVLILLGFFGFSVSERVGVRDFLRNRWIWCSVAGTVLGAVSAIYDKFLLQRLAVPRETVQACFTVDLLAVIGVYWLLLRRLKVEQRTFRWRWTLAATGVLLIVADALYFAAVGTPGTAISLLSLLRRTSVVVTCIGGVVFFKETNMKRRFAALALILAGAALIALG